MSQSTERLEKELQVLLLEVVAYNDKPNKSVSKRIRTGLGSIKKQTAHIRSELVALDKTGY
jgi:hypothetical protein